MSAATNEGRLPMWRAAWVVARRDFLAVLMSKTFIFFLLGPLFPFLIGGLAGGIGAEVRDTVDRPVLGMAMTGPDNAAFAAAHRQLQGELGEYIPALMPVADVVEGEPFDAEAALKSGGVNIGAIVGGSLANPQLYGPAPQVAAWQGRIGLIVRQAQAGPSPAPLPQIEQRTTASSSADQTRARLLTAQAGQLLLFMLTMLLAGMVLSNLVEEKGNKIIEILAAAIPMDAVFMGKLFAMLAISFVGISVWALVGAFGYRLIADLVPAVPPPAIGWAGFAALGIAYFSMAYLLLGSLFLAIGSLASTVREVQTLSMPVTMMQLMVFFLASYAMAQPGSTIELAAIAFPFSSPFTMLARAAQSPDLWPHLLALVYQAAWVAIFIRMGASLFRRRVMKSGSQNKRRWWQRRGKIPQ